MRSPYTLLISCLLFLLLSACATTAGYRQQMSQWQGKNIQTLTQQWGPPNAAIKLDNGHHIYQYIKRTFYTIPDPKRTPLHSNNNTLFSSYHKPWITGQTLVRYCRTSFETTSDGLIIHINFHGDNCIANRFIH